jgi:hypothetical protein
MLDLQAGVDLEEVKVAALVEDELDGARAHVPDRAPNRHRRFAHPRAQFGRQRYGGRFLHTKFVGIEEAKTTGMVTEGRPASLSETEIETYAEKEKETEADGRADANGRHSAQ